MLIYLKIDMPDDKGMTTGYKDKDGLVKHGPRVFMYKPTEVKDEFAKILISRYPAKYGKWDKEIAQIQMQKRANRKRIIQVPISVARQPKVGPRKRTDRDNETGDSEGEEISDEELNNPLLNVSQALPGDESYDAGYLGMEAPEKTEIPAEPVLSPQQRAAITRKRNAAQKAAKAAAQPEKSNEDPNMLPADEAPPSGPGPMSGE